jgi:hypothetical protein
LKAPALADSQSLAPGSNSMPMHGLTAARRIFLEKPNRVISGKKIQLFHKFGVLKYTAGDIPDNAGGALRVPKQLEDKVSVESKIQASKHRALRVPLSVAPSAEPHHASSVSTSAAVKDVQLPDDEHVKEKEKLVPKRRSANSSSSYQTSKSGNTSTQIQVVNSKSLDLVDLSNRLKNSDWSIRLASLESIRTYFKQSSADESTAKVSKLCDLLVIGLNDNHGKCINSAILCSIDLLQFHGTSDMLDAIFPRIVGIILYQPQKVKQSMSELGQVFLNTVEEKFGIEAVFMSAVHGLYNPEYAKNVKIRSGCLAFLASISIENWLPLLIKPSSKRIHYH